MANIKIINKAKVFTFNSLENLVIDENQSKYSDRFFCDNGYKVITLDKNELAKGWLDSGISIDDIQIEFLEETKGEVLNSNQVLPINTRVPLSSSQLSIKLNCQEEVSQPTTTGNPLENTPYDLGYSVLDGTGGTRDKHYFVALKDFWRYVQYLTPGSEDYKTLYKLRIWDPKGSFRYNDSTVNFGGNSDCQPISQGYAYSYDTECDNGIFTHNLTSTEYIDGKPVVFDFEFLDSNNSVVTKRFKAVITPRENE